MTTIVIFSHCNGQSFQKIISDWNIPLGFKAKDKVHFLSVDKLIIEKFNSYPHSLYFELVFFFFLPTLVGDTGFGG